MTITNCSILPLGKQSKGLPQEIVIDPDAKILPDPNIVIPVLGLDLKHRIGTAHNFRIENNKVIVDLTFDGISLKELRTCVFRPSLTIFMDKVGTSAYMFGGVLHVKEAQIEAVTQVELKKDVF